MSADLIKVLRSKCDDLEDQLDAEEEAWNAAKAANGELEEELLRLQSELIAEREATQNQPGAGEEAKTAGGEGYAHSRQEDESRKEVQELQATLADEHDKGQQLQEQLPEVTIRHHALQQELLEVDGKLAEEKKHLDQVRESLQLVEEKDRAQVLTARATKAELDGRSADLERRLQSMEAELADARALCSKQVADRETSLERLRAVKKGAEASKAELIVQSQELHTQEASLEQERCKEAASLRSALAETCHGQEDFLLRIQGLRASEPDMQGALTQAKASEATQHEELRKAGDLLGSMQAEEEEFLGLHARVDAALMEELECKELSREECRVVSMACDDAEERAQVADNATCSWRSMLSSVKQDCVEREAALQEDSERSIADLRARLMDEQESSEQLQIAHEDLDSIRCEKEVQMCEVTSFRQGLQVELSSANMSYDAARSSADDGKELAACAKAEWQDGQRCLERAHSETAELSKGLDEMLQEALKAEQTRDHETEQSLMLEQDLEAQQRMRMVEALSYQDVQQQYDEQMQELEAERKQHLQDMNERQLLLHQHGQLSRERDQEQQRLLDLGFELEAERSSRSMEDAELAESRKRCSELKRDGLAEERRLADFKEEMEAEKRLGITQSERLGELEAECNRLEMECKAIKEGRSHGKLELRHVTKAHNSERQCAVKLQVELEAVQPAHEALFTQYSSAMEQINSLQSERERVTLEKEGLYWALDEERERDEHLRKVREETEPPGPTQLSMGDVLISVAFEGVKAPLELKPWDTNLEEVVTEWITAVRIKPHLKQSILRYLKHLEESTQSFPVHAQARLVEVHEQFAL